MTLFEGLWYFGYVKDFALHLFRPSKKPHVILRLKRIVIESFSVGFRMSVHRRLLVVVLGTWGLVHPSLADAGDRLAKAGVVTGKSFL